MSFMLSEFFVGFQTSARPNVVVASPPVANGTDGRDFILDDGAGAVFAGGGDDVYLGGRHRRAGRWRRWRRPVVGRRRGGQPHRRGG